jgi:hypothetical protein
VINRTRGEKNMRYCPECFAEFEDFEKYCPDCGTNLAYRSFSPNSDEAAARLVTVAAYEHETEAALSRSGLAAEGIWSYITDNTRDSSTPLPPGFSAFVLQVSVSNAPNAVRILQRLWSGSISR